MTLRANDHDEASRKMQKLYGTGNWRPVTIQENIQTRREPHNTQAMAQTKVKKKTAKPAAKKAAKAKAAPKHTLGSRVERAAASKRVGKNAAHEKEHAHAMRPSEPKMSGLDAAFKTLEKYGKPMRAKEIVTLMAEDELWSSDAKTPEATIYSGMLTEIANKGMASRFKKDGPLFSVNEKRREAQA